LGFAQWVQWRGLYYGKWNGWVSDRFSDLSQRWGLGVGWGSVGVVRVGGGVGGVWGWTTELGWWCGNLATGNSGGGMIDRLQVCGRLLQ